MLIIIKKIIKWIYCKCYKIKYSNNPYMLNYLKFVENIDKVCKNENSIDCYLYYDQLSKISLFKEEIYAEYSDKEKYEYSLIYLKNQESIAENIDSTISCFLSILISFVTTFLFAFIRIEHSQMLLFVIKGSLLTIIIGIITIIKVGVTNKYNCYIDRTYVICKILKEYVSEQEQNIRNN